jgi:PKD repeat protein
VAEAASHEAGHTLGLSHDGQNDGSPYYAGHGSWAPIMGNSYGKEVTQWSKGEYTAANNTEDDLAVVQKYGAKYRADDHGNTLAAATRLSGAAPAAKGLILNQSDVDVFAFTTKAGSISFTVDVAPRGPDLDVQLALLDANGNQISVSNSSVLGTALSATVEAGQYYLRLNGIGSGNPATTGYSSYASIGEYKLVGSVVDPGTQIPIADATASPTSGDAPLAVTFSGAGSSDPDGSIASYAWNFGNGGTSTEANPSHTYTSVGTFRATLTVTDNRGDQNSQSITITVTPPPSRLIFVSDINMTVQRMILFANTATAEVIIKDNLGAVRSGVTVSGRWSGVTSGNVTGKTDSNGRVTFTSLRSTKSGNFYFSVTDAAAAGYEYAPDRNVQTSDSIVNR